ncbi:MAG: DUF2163 domain-containing protein [Pseudomonadota bacterium]
MSGAEVLKARLASGVSTLCRCWEVVRTDGTRLGFTDHDCNLTFEGLSFEAGAGLTAGALERSTGLNVDNGQAVGALRSDRVNEADILAGRYDDASVRQWLVDWSEPEARVVLFSGTIGEVRSGAGAFEAEVRGLSEALNVPVGRVFGRTCDRDLGDAKCGVVLTSPAFVTEASVQEVNGETRLRWEPSQTYEPEWFEGGAFEWLDGANAGLTARIRADQIVGDARWVTLWSEPRLPVALGDRFKLTAGCDKRLETCRAKFANAINFRGFPHMPGEDWVTAYPRSGDVHDGASNYWQEVPNE